jgi:PAS domain-containing protein
MAELLMPLARLPGPAAGNPAAADAQSRAGRSGAPTERDGAEVRPVGPPATPSALARWGAAAAGAADAALVLDRTGSVVSVSAAAAGLLGRSRAEVLRRRLLDELPLVDFDTGARQPDYAGRIPPLAAMHAGSLMRGLLRVDRPAGRVTLDVISAPLRESDGAIVGSLSFLAAIAG